MKKTQLFFMNALIMTATSLLLSTVGVWFNLYISERLGPVGMGVFQLMMSVYSMLVTFACSGINLATTRMVAEEAVLPNGDISGAIRRCLGYCLFFGGLASCVLWFGAPTIGTRFLRSTATIRPLRIMAMSMPCIAMSSALNGYFTAVRRVVKSVSCQILEQFLRITLTIFILTAIAPAGLEYACMSITAAGVVAEITSCLFELILCLFDRRRYPSGHTAGLSKKLLGIALPVAFSTYLRTGLSTIKHLLVPIRLQASGLSAPASLAMFGALHGVALPVILFPYAFLNAFNALIVPELAQSHCAKQDVSQTIDRMFALTLGCSLGVCGILFSFHREIGALVSTNPDVGIYIRLLAPVIPIMYLDTAVDSMLKGLDEQLSVMRYNVLDAAVSLASVWLLLPVLGIKGYIFVVCGSELFNFSLSLGRLIRVTGFRLDITARVIHPLLCSALAMTVVELLFRKIPAVPGRFATCCMIASAACIYLFLLRVSKYARV